MPFRLLLILTTCTLVSSSCIFAPQSTEPGQDSGAADVQQTDASDDGATDIVDDDRCPTCIGTWAGTGVRGAMEGPLLQAQFDTLSDIAVSSEGSTVYLADRFAHRIWRVRDGRVETLAGTGSCSATAGTPEGADELCEPRGMELVGPDDMYVTECATGKIKRVLSGEIQWVAGTNDDTANWEGDATSTRLDCPSDIASADDNRLYIAGNDSHRIHEFAESRLTVLAGGEAGYRDSENPDEVRFHNPTSLVHDGDNQRLIVLDRSNNCLRGVSLADATRGATTTVAGKCGQPGPTEPGPASSTRFDDLRGLEFDGDTLYLFSRSQLVAIDFASPELRVEAVAGLDVTSHHRDGPVDRAKLHGPRAVTPYVDDRGKASLLIAEYQGRTVRKWKHIDPASDLPAVPGETDGPTIETVAGTGFRGDVRGLAAESEFAAPSDIVRFGDRYLVADRLNNQILEYRNGAIEVFAGTGDCAPANDEPVSLQSADLCQPSDIFADGRTVYIVQRTNHVVSRIDLDQRTLTTVVGSARPGTQAWTDADWEGNPLDVKLYFPEAVTMDTDGNLYIAGGLSHAIHRLNAAGDDVKLYAGKVEDSGFENAGVSDAKFDYPSDIVHVEGNLFVADANNHCVRRIVDDQVKTALGQCEQRGAIGGAPEDARFDLPIQLLSADYDSDSAQELIILDRVGVSILDGEQVQVQRVGAAWQGWRDGALNKVGLTRPTGVALTEDGGLLVTERDGDRLRKITF